MYRLLRGFCVPAVCQQQHASAVIGVLTVCDPVNGACPVRPASSSLCEGIEFEPPEDDCDFLDFQIGALL